MMWFWFSLITLLCWSGSDLFSKIGCRDGSDKNAHLKMVMAVGAVMGLHAAYEVFVNGVYISWEIILTYLPVSLLYIGLGLLCGSIFDDKQVGGICGALLTNLSAWLSGIWFDLELVGGMFKKISYALPFVHAVEMERAVLAGNFRDILPHLLWVLGYAVVTLTAAVFLFLRQMKKQ